MIKPAGVGQLNSGKCYSRIILVGAISCGQEAGGGLDEIEVSGRGVTEGGTAGDGFKVTDPANVVNTVNDASLNIYDSGYRGRKHISEF